MACLLVAISSIDTLGGGVPVSSSSRFTRDTLACLVGGTAKGRGEGPHYHLSEHQLESEALADAVAPTSSRQSSCIGNGIPPSFAPAGARQKEVGRGAHLERGRRRSTVPKPSDRRGIAHHVRTCISSSRSNSSSLTVVQRRRVARNRSAKKKKVRLPLTTRSPQSMAFASGRPAPSGLLWPVRRNRPRPISIFQTPSSLHCDITSTIESPRA